jgi:uncharacterized membrane protein
MRAVSLILLLLAGCGGSESVTVPAANVAAKADVQPPAPVSLAGVDFAGPVHTFGTEPYWALDISPERIRFQDFSIDDGEPDYWAPAVAKAASNGVVIETRTPAGEAATISFTGESCLEVGEEENRQPLTAVVKIGTRTLTGCAGQKEPEPVLSKAGNAMP